MPSVSVIIRARDEAALIGRCLDTIAAQDYPEPIEVLVIDSGSKDGTVGLVRSRPSVQLIQIPPAEFNYGRTLNFGVQRARGKLVVALSAHCVPLDTGWLRALTTPLATPEVVGAFGRQVPWPGCEPVEAYDLTRTFPNGDTIQREYPPGGDLEVLFSNANGCFRRADALARPFRELPWAEDRVWAAEALKRGASIAYVAAAAVYHSHNRSICEYYRLGQTLGTNDIALGRPNRPLSNAGWFGLRKLYWTLNKWYSRLGHGNRASRMIYATRAVAREMAMDVGRISGWHAANRRLRADRGDT